MSTPPTYCVCLEILISPADSFVLTSSSKAVVIRSAFSKWYIGDRLPDTYKAFPRIVVYFDAVLPRERMCWWLAKETISDTFSLWYFLFLFRFRGNDETTRTPRRLIPYVASSATPRKRSVRSALWFATNRMDARRAKKEETVADDNYVRAQRWRATKSRWRTRGKEGKKETDLAMKCIKLVTNHCQGLGDRYEDNNLFFYESNSIYDRRITLCSPLGRRWRIGSNFHPIANESGSVDGLIPDARWCQSKDDGQSSFLLSSSFSSSHLSAQYLFFWRETGITVGNDMIVIVVIISHSAGKEEVE